MSISLGLDRGEREMHTQPAFGIHLSAPQLTRPPAQATKQFKKKNCNRKKFCPFYSPFMVRASARGIAPFWVILASSGFIWERLTRIMRVRFISSTKKHRKVDIETD